MSKWVVPYWKAHRGRAFSYLTIDLRYATTNCLQSFYDFFSSFFYKILPGKNLKRLYFLDIYIELRD